MDYLPGQGVISTAFGTGTVVSQDGDIVTVRFDKSEFGDKKLKEQFLQPSNHAVKPLPEKKKGPGHKKVTILPSGEFENYLLHNGCSISASMPPKQYPKFQSDYEVATGYKITKETSGVSILRDDTKRWALTMIVRFPKPTDNFHIPYETYSSPQHPNELFIANNGFIWELFRHGFVLGRNDLQSAANALAGEPAAHAASLEYSTLDLEE
jgi:hypothetical protein